MKTIKILTIVLLPVLLFACNRIFTEKIPDEIKPYIMFPEGSYWVYQDSVTGSIDTVTLTSQYTENAFSDFSGKRVENLYQEYFSSYRDTIFYGVSYWGDPEIFELEIHIFFYGEIGEDINNAYIELIIENFQPYNKKTFVIKTLNSRHEKYKRVNYWTEDVGITKQIDNFYFDGSYNDTLIVKNLIDYNINN